MNKTNKLLLHRAIAVYIDLFIFTLLSMISYSIFNLYNRIDSYVFVMIMGNLLMILRDLLGRSVGKCIMKLKIVNFDNEASPTLWQRLIRNITGPIAFVDVFFILLRKDHRRLGDILAKTNVSHQFN